METNDTQPVSQVEQVGSDQQLQGPDSEVVRHSKWPIYAGVLLVVIILIVGGFFYMKSRLGTPAALPQSQTSTPLATAEASAASPVSITQYSGLDFYDVLALYYKNKGTSEKSSLVAALQVKMDELIQKGGLFSANSTASRTDFRAAFTALDVVSRTRDAAFYDYFASLFQKYEKLGDALSLKVLIARLALLGDVRATPLLLNLEGNQSITDPNEKSSVLCFARTGRMMLGDESSLNLLLQCAESKNPATQEDAIVGLGYSNSQAATDRLNRFISEKWLSFYAKLALFQQKLNKMSASDQAQYLFDHSANFYDSEQTEWFKQHVLALPYDEKHKARMVSYVEDSFNFFLQQSLAYGQNSKQGQKVFIREYLASDNLRDWAEEKLNQLAKLPGDQGIIFEY